MKRSKAPAAIAVKWCCGVRAERQSSSARTNVETPGGTNIRQALTERRITRLPANTAERNFKAMEIKNGNTAPERAMPTAEDLIEYQTLLALLSTLHTQGEIDDATRDTAGRLMAMKCGMKQTSIFI